MGLSLMQLSLLTTMMLLKLLLTEAFKTPISLQMLLFRRARLRAIRMTPRSSCEAMAHGTFLPFLVDLFLLVALLDRALLKTVVPTSTLCGPPSLVVEVGAPYQSVVQPGRH